MKKLSVKDLIDYIGKPVYVYTEGKDWFWLVIHNITVDGDGSALIKFDDGGGYEPEYGDIDIYAPDGYLEMIAETEAQIRAFAASPAGTAEAER